MAERRTNQNEGGTSGRRGAGNGGKAGTGEEPTASTGEETNESRAMGAEREGRLAARPGREARWPARFGGRDFGSAGPFGLMRQLSRDMDRFMDSFLGARFGSLLGEMPGRGDDWPAAAGWTPRIDVRRRDDAIVVRADLPGVRKEDVQIDIDDNALILSGQRQEERTEGTTEQGYQLLERSYGSFYRRIPLPQGANMESCKAEMRDGVLSITLPLEESAKPRRIQIED